MSSRLHIDEHREYFHQYSKEDLVRQDWLALDRTAAANKRTLYAFMRTTIDFNVAGLIFVRFFSYPWIMAVGVVFILISVVLGGYALSRFYQVHRHYQRFLRNHADVRPSDL